MDQVDTWYYESPLGKLSLKFISENPGWEFKKYYVTYGCSPYYIPYDQSNKEQTMKWIQYIHTDGMKMINNYNPIDAFKSDSHYLSCPDENKSMYLRNMIIPVKLTAPELITYQEDDKQRLFRTTCWYNECIQLINRQNNSLLEQKRKMIEQAKINQDYQEKERQEAEKYKNIEINRVKHKLNYPLTDDEIEAIIAKFIPEGLLGIRPLIRYKNNTLLALQVMNRYARDNEIRVEDAETVFKDIWKY